MDQTISRRTALATGTLCLGAGLLGTAGAPTAPAVVAQPLAPTIDHAEALLLELAGILPRLSERDQSNVGQVLDMLGSAAGLRADLMAEGIADALAYVGPGRRVMDVIDAEEAAEQQPHAGHAVAVRRIEGDEAVLCAIARADEWSAIVANSRYPEAEAHAHGHLARGLAGVQLCAPDCDGAQS